MSRGWAWVGLGVAALVLLVVGARSEPTEGTSDDRLFAIASEMKCLQCIGENVANSQAPIAVQMRDEIRRQMQAGQTDDEIYTFFADRYGPQVLLNPSGGGFTALVWVIPVVAVAVAGYGLALVLGRARRRRDGAAEVSAEDRGLVEGALSERRRGGAAGDPASPSP